MRRPIQNIILIALLMAGAGVLYHYLVYIPRLDEQKIEASARLEREKWKFEAQERRKIAAQENQERAELSARKKSKYDICLVDARRLYDVSWDKACSDDAKDTLESLKRCLPPTNSSDAYLLSKTLECSHKFNLDLADGKPNCNLKPSLAETINQLFVAEKAKCLAEAEATM